MLMLQAMIWANSVSLTFNEVFLGMWGVSVKAGILSTPALTGWGRWGRRASNPQLAVLETAVLPPELRPQSPPLVPLSYEGIV